MGTPVLIKEFKKEEFACKCGECGMGYEQMQQTTLYKLFTARKRSSVKFVVRSAVRCDKHNMLEGGKNNSAHKSGYAVDIGFKDMHECFIILKALIEGGFERIGINFQLMFIHVDDDPTKPKGVFRY